MLRLRGDGPDSVCLAGIHRAPAAQGPAVLGRSSFFRSGPVVNTIRPFAISVSTPLCLLPSSCFRMFTGLVESLAEVVRVESRPPGRLIVLRGAATSGRCAVGRQRGRERLLPDLCSDRGGAAVVRGRGRDAQPYQLGELAPGSAVNVETSLAMGDKLRWPPGHRPCRRGGHARAA